MQLSSRTLMNIATVLVMPEEAWWLAAAGVARTIEMSADGARPAIVSTDHQAALFDASPFAPELPTGLVLREFGCTACADALGSFRRRLVAGFSRQASGLHALRRRHGRLSRDLCRHRCAKGYEEIHA